MLLLFSALAFAAPCSTQQRVARPDPADVAHPFAIDSIHSGLEQRIAACISAGGNL
jgi:hypothetical protein